MKRNAKPKEYKSLWEDEKPTETKGTPTSPDEAEMPVGSPELPDIEIDVELPTGTE